MDTREIRFTYPNDYVDCKCHGSSLLFFTATYDLLSVFHTKWAIDMTWEELARGGTQVITVHIQDS